MRPPCGPRGPGLPNLVARRPLASPADTRRPRRWRGAEPAARCGGRRGKTRESPEEGSRSGVPGPRRGASQQAGRWAWTGLTAHARASLGLEQGERVCLPRPPRPVGTTLTTFPWTALLPRPLPSTLTPTSALGHAGAAVHSPRPLGTHHPFPALRCCPSQARMGACGTRVGVRDEMRPHVHPALRGTLWGQRAGGSPRHGECSRRAVPARPAAVGGCSVSASWGGAE